MVFRKLSIILSFFVLLGLCACKSASSSNEGAQAVSQTTEHGFKQAAWDKLDLGLQRAWLAASEKQPQKKLECIMRV